MHVTDSLYFVQIDTDREPVPDAPAVYFVRPTEANIKRIAEDCAKQVRLPSSHFPSYRMTCHSNHVIIRSYQLYRTVYLNS